MTIASATSRAFMSSPPFRFRCARLSRCCPRCHSGEYCGAAWSMSWNTGTQGPGKPLGHFLAGFLRKHFDPVAPELLVALIGQQMAIRHLRPAPREPERLGVELRVGHRHLGDEHATSLCIGAIQPVALDDDGFVGMRRGALV